MDSTPEPSPAPPRSGYWLTRFLMLRLLAFVYLFAFLSAARQIVPLVGDHGLLPARDLLERATLHFGSRAAAAAALPSLFWIHLSDAALRGVAWTGVALSALALVGYANAIVMALLWLLYGSLVHVGQLWYGYGWEIQLLETGFLGIFLCPLLDGRPFPRRPPPTAVIWLHRWLIFRIMLGAGLIKLRGDPCWRDLSCLDHHYETQPIPNPLSRTFHFLPRPVHRLGVLMNHATELVAPWFAFGPRLARTAAGALMLLFQLLLIASGNLSFLNYLTVVPILACFDDATLRHLLPRALVRRAERAVAEAVPSHAQQVAAAALAVTVAVLSVRPVANLMSGSQIMNTSFDPLDLVNTYGAFGSVGRERREIVLEGTADAVPDERARWRAYELPCKPGDPLRRPCVVSPYQPRLDWQLWFAAMSTPEAEPWMLHLVWKLLHGDSGTLALFAGDPFPDAPPRWIRAELYRYRFARPGEPGHPWWERERIGPWLPPLAADDPRLRELLRAYGWLGEGAASPSPAPEGGGGAGVPP